MVRHPIPEVGVGFVVGIVVGLSLQRYDTSDESKSFPQALKNTLSDKMPVQDILEAPPMGKSQQQKLDSTPPDDDYLDVLGKKREAFCLAQAIEAPPWGSPKTLKRTPDEIEAAMKRVFDRNVLQMLAAGGDGAFQHSHDYLNSNSVVVEIGGNKGIFCEELLKRYALRELHVIEPVTPMVKNLRVKFAANGSVRVHQFALAKTSGTLRMAYRSDEDAAAKILGPDDKAWPGTGDQSASSHCFPFIATIPGATIENVPVKTFKMAWDIMQVKKVDLININIEGIEFELVQALLDSGIQKNIRNIQIQWHVHAGIVVANKAQKRCAMQSILSRTHYLVYNFDWVWEHWTLKPGGAA